MRRPPRILNLIVLVLLVPVVCQAQEAISEASLQASSQQASENSTQQSTGASSETSSQESTANSSQYSSEHSFQWSTDATTEQSSPASTEATTQGSAESAPWSVALMVAGAVVTVAVIVGGIILTVHVSEAREEAILGLQDQIYLADGKDYQDLLTFFELEDRDLISANDAIVAAGHQIAGDQDAADYLAVLILALAEKSRKVQYQLRML